MERESLAEKAAYFLGAGRGLSICPGGSMATGFLLGACNSGQRGRFWDNKYTNIHRVKPSCVGLWAIAWIVFETESMAMADTVIRTLLVTQLSSICFLLFTICRLWCCAARSPWGD